MALRFTSRTKPRRGNVTASVPGLLAVGSGSAGNPTFSGIITADTPGMVALGSGSFTGGSSGEGNDGLVVTNYATYDPDNAIIQSLDVNSTLPNWGSAGGSSIAFNSGAWWNGTTGVARMRPPTVESASGLGDFQVWKNATKAVRQLNLRFEWRPSALYCSQLGLPKFLLIRSYRQLQTVPTVPVVRPMFYLCQTNESGSGNHDGPFDIQNAIHLVPAQGTNRCYMDYNMVPAPTGAQWQPGITPTTYQNMRCPFYYRATSGVDSGGNPILEANEIVCIEARFQAMETSGEPNGIIGFRVTRRNGQVFERCCGWTWDDNGISVNEAYIETIEQFGGGYYNVGDPSNPAVYTEVGRRITIATNYQPTVGRAWIGPPEGFVTG